MRKLFKRSTILQVHATVSFMLSALSAHTVVRAGASGSSVHLGDRHTDVYVTSEPHLCQDALCLCFGVIVRLVICCQWQVRYISCIGRVLLQGLRLTPYRERVSTATQYLAMNIVDHAITCPSSPIRR